MLVLDSMLLDDEVLIEDGMLVLDSVVMEDDEHCKTGPSLYLHLS